MQYLPHAVERFRWIHRHGRPWLIVGKGPSISKYTSDLNERYNVVALNQAATFVVHCVVAHFIDYGAMIDTLLSTGMSPDERMGSIVMPWVPHFRELPMGGTLDVYMKTTPTLRAFGAAGRLYSYDLQTAKEVRKYSNHPVVTALAFSVEAVTSLMGMAGISVVHTLGVDGGLARAEAFKDCHRENNTISYDHQFQNLELVKKKYGMTILPLEV